MVRFEPLIRCKAPGCDALLEPDREFCNVCRPNFARGPGRVKPDSPPGTPPGSEKPKPSPQQKPDECCGPRGFYDCPDGASVDRRHAKRCPTCAAAAKSTSSGEQARPKRDRTARAGAGRSQRQGGGTQPRALARRQLSTNQKRGHE